MGLDQYAGVMPQDDTDFTATFVWRKHSRLQAWAEALFKEKTGKGAEHLNCGTLPLDIEDIETLRSLIVKSALPTSEGGFFYGHQFQDEAAAQYAEQDLEFCDWAKEALSNGKTVVYSCWW